MNFWDVRTSFDQYSYYSAVLIEYLGQLGDLFMTLG